MGVIVAAGMMGGLALMLAQMTKQQAVTQRKAETGLDMNQLHHRILGVLYDGDACLKTLTDGTDSVHNGRTLQKLLNKGGKTVVETGQDINRTVRVEKMEVQGIPSPRTGQTEEGHLIVTIKKLGIANEGMGSIIKKFPLTLELESASSNKIVRCHHTLDSKEHGIHTNICKSLGGEMQERGSPTTECTLTNVYKTFCESIGGEYTDPAVGVAVGKCDMNFSLMKFCDSMQGSYADRTPFGECNIKDTYVDVAGDTMTGDLNAPNVHAASTVTAGGGGGKTPSSTPQVPSPGTPSPSIPSTPSPGTPWNSGLTPCPGYPGHYVIPPEELAERKAKAIESNNSCYGRVYPYYRWRVKFVGLSFANRKPCFCMKATKCNGGRWRQVSTATGICGTDYFNESYRPASNDNCAPSIRGGVSCP